MNEKGSWKKGSIEGGSSFVYSPKKERFEGRGLDDYCKKLGLEETELIGKQILDLGAGPTARLERELGERAYVVSLSPDYSDHEYASWLQDNEGVVKNAIAALGDALPFKDGTEAEGFDYVLMLHVTEYLSLEKLQLVISEGCRVAKRGDGKVAIFPVPPGMQRILQEYGERMGVDCVIEPTEYTVKMYDGGMPAGYATINRAVFKKH